MTDQVAFPVKFVKHVFDADTPDPDARFAVFVRESTLPFAPVPGHSMRWPAGGDDKLSSVAWDLEKNQFVCTIDDEFVDPLDIESFDFDELLDELKSSGWQLVKVWDKK